MRERIILLPIVPLALAGLREHCTHPRLPVYQLGEWWQEEENRMGLSQGTVKQSHGSLQKELGTSGGELMTKMYADGCAIKYWAQQEG